MFHDRMPNPWCVALLRSFVSTNIKLGPYNEPPIHCKHAGTLLGLDGSLDIAYA
jgi:hypothetical protein